MKKSFAGGCSSFGHSCFGGHGKRSDGIGALGNGPSLRGLQSDTLLGQQSKYGQDEVAMPKPIYPQSSNMDLGNGDDIIPIRNGGKSYHYRIHLSILTSVTLINTVVSIRIYR